MVVEVDGNPVLNERMRGKFLIDAATFRLWREEREITVQPAGFDARWPPFARTSIIRTAISGAGA